jgi:general secretion pathway protein D
VPFKDVVIKDDQVNIFFDDADVFEVLQTVFGEVLKASYMIDPKVKGYVNLRTVKPVKKSEVLPLMEKVLWLNGIGIIKEDELYRIVPAGDVPSEMPKIHVYPVQNSKAKDVTSLLQQIFSNMVATKARPASSPQQRGAPASPPGDTMISSSTRLIADEVSNMIIILAAEKDYSLIEETIRQIDVAPRQVLIEGFIAEVTLTDNWSLGFAWSLKVDLDDLSGFAGQNASEIATEDFSEPISGSGFTLLGVDTSGIVRAKIEALSQKNKVKLLASPHILVSDNREARIQVGQQVPIVTSETAVEGTTDIQRTVQYKDVGIILKVKPLVNESGLVTLEITQEVSYVSGQVEGTTDIVLDKTEATTHLVSQDGETIIIGGLIREDKSREKSGIPILSDIPILGYLFGSNSKNSSRKELIILLTPHVMRSQKEAVDKTREYIEKFNRAEKEIPYEPPE